MMTGGGYDGFSLKVARAELEDKMIRKALAATGGNRTHAANMLRDQPPFAVKQDEAVWYRISVKIINLDCVIGRRSIPIRLPPSILAK
jgi:hypothetical protein